MWWRKCGECGTWATWEDGSWADRQAHHHCSVCWRHRETDEVEVYESEWEDRKGKYKHSTSRLKVLPPTPPRSRWAPAQACDARSRSRSCNRKPTLWAAVEQGEEEAVRTLLQDGKNPEERFQGWTPLMKAAEEDQETILRLLLDRKCDTEAVNSKGRTALSFAAAPSWYRPTAASALQLLLDRGADVWQKDNTGMTAKDRARKEMQMEAVTMIEEAERARVPIGG